MCWTQQHSRSKIKARAKPIIYTKHQANEAKKMRFMGVNLTVRNWDEVFTASDVDEKVNIFTTTLNNPIN